MRPTRPVVLAAVFAAVALAAFVGARVVYSALPPLPVSAPVLLFVLALAEAGMAQSVRSRLQGRPRTKPIMPLAVARVAALAKASSLAGAVFAGGYAGLLGYLASHGAGRDVPIGAAGFVGAVALVVAALLLEGVCRVPRPPAGSEDERAAAE
ncbi:MAG TPA: DUF3180 domain-containing protein [Mycobacteriales bacterium]|nr:DUF3180 domain-containing protein [Mycobacteriales bacterium]